MLPAYLCGLPYVRSCTERNTEIPALYRQQENAKKREYAEYGDRIREVEYAVFTPLAFSSYNWWTGERDNYRI